MAQRAAEYGPNVRPFIVEDSTAFARTHVRVIDGTGSAAKEDQTVVVSDGKIAAIGDAASTRIPQNAKVIDRTGYSIIPGLVGMHDHLFYTGAEQGNSDNPTGLVHHLPFSFPRLYLAMGVTTIRTTGTFEPYIDQWLKKYINRKQVLGPKINITAPYLDGEGTAFGQMHELSGPEEARKFSNFWMDSGFETFKAYTHITRAELGAAIKEAHKRGIKVTGHLCSVTFTEAAELGIDNLEHGFRNDYEFVPGKKPDDCPPGSTARYLKDITPQSPQFQQVIKTLIAHKVAITSTLAGGIPPDARQMDLLSSDSKIHYLTSRANSLAASVGNEATGPEASIRKEMELEYAFAKAGGTLLSGPDPTGNGGIVAGFGDLNCVIMLTRAGFTVPEAIHIATYNGAQFLGVLKSVGSLEPGKSADIVVIRGDISKKIEDIINVETVFKDGIGYDSAKIVDTVRGQVGIR